MTRFHIAVHDVHAPLRDMRQEARRIAAPYPAITEFQFELRPSGDEFEAHVDLRLREHQVIFNAVGETPEAAARQALARVARELARLAARDHSIARAPHAEAA